MCLLEWIFLLLLHIIVRRPDCGQCSRTKCRVVANNEPDGQSSAWQLRAKADGQNSEVSMVGTKPERVKNNSWTTNGRLLEWAQSSLRMFTTEQCEQHSQNSFQGSLWGHDVSPSVERASSAINSPSEISVGEPEVVAEEFTHPAAVRRLC